MLKLKIQHIHHTYSHKKKPLLMSFERGFFQCALILPLLFLGCYPSFPHMFFHRLIGTYSLWNIPATKASSALFFKDLMLLLIDVFRQQIDYFRGVPFFRADKFFPDHSLFIYYESFW